MSTLSDIVYLLDFRGFSVWTFIEIYTQLFYLQENWNYGMVKQIFVF